MTGIDKDIDSTKTIKSVIITSTVVCYIIFSIIKRWGNNEQLFWIPLVLTLANVAILLEIIFTQKKGQIKDKFWLYHQTLLNLILATLVVSFLYNW